MGKRSTTACAFICAFGVLCAASLPAKGDHFLLRNGVSIDGTVTAEDDQSVIVDVSNTEIAMSRRIDKSAILQWDRPAGPPYVILPVTGEIGADITAGALRDGFVEAKRLGARYVVLLIDSPGGSIGEMNDIIDLVINESKEFDIVACVKEKAYSAAAVIAMACRNVYIQPTASIGACVPFSITENGPQDVEAKMRSAIEAKMRAAVAHGQHADLLIRGMSEIGLEIYLTQENGKPILSTTGPGKLIKPKGEILCLTAQEAEECGLARRASSLTEVGEQLVGGPWHEAGRLPWDRVIATATRARQERAVEAAVARYGPQIANIEQRISSLSATIQADRASIANLVSVATFETKQLDVEYQQATQNAKYQPNPNAWLADTVQSLNSRAAEIRQGLETHLLALKGEIDAATSELNSLRGQENGMLAGGSSE
jgi:Clp protease